MGILQKRFSGVEVGIISFVFLAGFAGLCVYAYLQIRPNYYGGVDFIYSSCGMEQCPQDVAYVDERFALVENEDFQGSVGQSELVTLLFRYNTKTKSVSRIELSDLNALSVQLEAPNNIELRRSGNSSAVFNQPKSYFINPESQERLELGTLFGPATYDQTQLIPDSNVSIVAWLSAE